MGWSLGFDHQRKRDIGYGVPAVCDHPGCDAAIDRGLSYVCGEDPYGGEYGCGLFFCDAHLEYAGKRRKEKALCRRCYRNMPHFEPKPDTPLWNRHKLYDPSWKEWREANPDQVKASKAALPPELTYVMTDIHGRLDLLELALAEIDRRGGGKLVFLGDYVDRGPDSFGVVCKLQEMSKREDVVCLRGNHEDIFSCFVTGSYDAGYYRACGGAPTLTSYEVVVGIEDRRILMEEHAEWMRGLPRYHKDGKRLFVHAGILPGIPVEHQQGDVLAWIRSREFFEAERIDMGYHVVHGHTHTHALKPDPAVVELTPARTNLDVAAFHTNRLAVGVFDQSQERPSEIFYVEQK